MTLEPQDKKNLSDLRIDKAYKSLNDAKANFNEGRFETSVNRSYYAILAAIRSILILEGADPKTHDGAITMFSLRFVKTGILPKDHVKKFEILHSRRTDVDYGDLEIVEKADAEDSLKIAEEIIGEIDRVRKKLIESLNS